MPTVLRTKGYRFYFFSNENDEPPHVHIDKGGASLKAWLEPVALARNLGFRPHEINAILRLVEADKPKLLEAWHDYFSETE
ncbi:MAG: DUF4160 domain-containing protein [Pseudomonadota bacterium]